MEHATVRWLALLGWILCVTLPELAYAQNHPDTKQQFDKHYKNAQAYAQLNQYPNAAREFLAAYKLIPNPDLLYNAGLAYWLGSDQAAALAEYARYLKVAPSGVFAGKAREAFYEVAETEWQNKAFGAALDHYEKYIKYNGKDNVDRARERFFEYAEQVWQSGQKDSSLAHYDRFVRLSPDHVNAPIAHKRVFELAEELWHAGDQERALDYYQRFATSEPKVAETAIARSRIFERGEAFWQRGEKDRAIAYYERYLTIERNDEIAQRALRRIAERKAEFEKARLAAEKEADRARQESLGAKQGAVVSQVGQDDAMPTVTRAGGRTHGRGSRFRVSALLHAALDHKARGAAAVAGVDVDLGLGVDVRVAGVLGPTMGTYIGGAKRFGMLRSLNFTMGVGLPVFFSHGVRIGVRGSGGLEWRAMRHVALMLELGVEHVFNPEWNREATALVPLIGVRAH